LGRDGWIPVCQVPSVIYGLWTFAAPTADQRAWGCHGRWLDIFPNATFFEGDIGSHLPIGAHLKSLGTASSWRMSIRAPLRRLPRGGFRRAAASSNRTEPFGEAMPPKLFQSWARTWSTLAERLSGEGSDVARAAKLPASLHGWLQSRPIRRCFALISAAQPTEAVHLTGC
jgi:hypothetical protein